MGIITKGMGVIIKGAKKPKTKLANTWQGRRVQAMNRIIKKHPNIPGYTRSQTDRFMDEFGKVSSSTAKTKKEYKGKK